VKVCLPDSRSIVDHDVNTSPPNLSAAIDNKLIFTFQQSNAKHPRLDFRHEHRKPPARLHHQRGEHRQRQCEWFREANRMSMLVELNRDYFWVWLVCLRSDCDSGAITSTTRTALDVKFFLRSELIHKIIFVY
jgi:hypothetical protein